MDLEFHQLDRRYETLRRSSPDQEKRVLGSLARLGQQAPVIVVPGADAGHYVLVDGFKRLRSLIRLHADTIAATAWALAESDALLLERGMRSAVTDTPLDQGWLLRELRHRFGLSIDELARRLDRSPSWVSGRLGLVAQLPDEIQEQVRTGQITAHAAMRFLVPFARANRDDCLRLAHAIGPLRPSSRQTEALCVAFQSGSEQTRARLLADPALVLRAREEARCPDALPKAPAAALVADLDALAAIARRVHRRLRQEVAAQLVPTERDEVRRSFRQAKADAEILIRHMEKEFNDARPEHPNRDPQIA